MTDLLDANRVTNSEHELIKVENLTSTYTTHKYLILKKKNIAIKDISFSLNKGQTLALLGDAGSGKSTLLKIINGNYIQDSGTIHVHGKPLNEYDQENRANLVRMLYGRNEASINPHLKIQAILENPLIINTKYNASNRTKRIARVLEYVGLTPEYVHFYPVNLTYIERLKLSIAYTIIINPHILLVDNFIEDLDTNLRTQVMNMLIDNQKRHGTAVIVCLNDLNLIKHIADFVLILNQGEVVEFGTVKDVLANPQNEYTKRIVQSTNNEYRISI